MCSIGLYDIYVYRDENGDFKCWLKLERKELK